MHNFSHDEVVTDSFYPLSAVNRLQDTPWARALPEDFLSRVTVLPNGCWQWGGHKKTDSGYGVYWNGGGQRYVHRISYQAAYGSIPPKIEIDHLCENKACVNPAHLEAVAHIVNIRRYFECRDLSPKPPKDKRDYNYRKEVRAYCRRGKHVSCYASTCSCSCHFLNGGSL